MEEHHDDKFIDRSHRIRGMSGRDPLELGRTATPLELLFDLVFVVAIGQAAHHYAHLASEGHFLVAAMGLAFAMFAIMWGWINYSWFASAFDTDDWPYRVATMIQMIGVTVLGLGLAPMFHSMSSGHAIDNRVMVAGYVVMRVAMVSLWLRAARQSPQFRSQCLVYATIIFLAQVGWVAMSLAHLALPATLFFVASLLLIELAGPYIAERFIGQTPWHAHHIAERYGLLTIIALGEGVVGTVVSLSAAVTAQGWTLDAALIAVSGMGLTFGMWWCYFLLPVGEKLHAHRRSAFVWGYGNIPLIAAIVATGAGLHVSAMYIEHTSHIGPVATVLSVSIPVALYLTGLYLLYHGLFSRLDPFHLGLFAISTAILFIAILLAYVGLSVSVSLLVVMLVPAVTVVGYEVKGHLYLSRAIKGTKGN